MNKSFAEMMEIDVSPYVKQRDGADYMPWSSVVTLLHKNGAEKVWYETLHNDKGHSLFMSDQVFTDKSGNTNRCYEVRVQITVDDDTFTYTYPILNGINPVKDNTMNQREIHKAIQRALVKAVAIRYGLGFSLWARDEIDEAPEAEDLSKHSLYAVKERFQTEYTRLIKKGMSTSEIAEALEMTTDEVKLHFSFFDSLDRFEKKMQRL